MAPVAMAVITTAAITITVMGPAAAAITTAAITITAMGPAAAQAVAITITLMAAATAIPTVMAAATTTAAAVTAAAEAANWNTKAREAGRMDRRTPAVPMKSMIIRSDMDIRRPDTTMIRRKTRTSITLTLPDA